jgi:GT2 family glycosyltransferase
VARGPRVVTVVLNYRHYEDALRCVASLQASTYLDHNIVVVDNTEPERKWDGFRRRLDRCVELIDAGGNVGFAAGCNLGIRRALSVGAEFIWLVNPDVVVAPDTLERLIAAAERHPDAGVFGCRILDNQHPPRIHFNGGVIDPARGGATAHRDQGLIDADVPDELREVDYVTGACFLVRRSVVRRVGPMPEEYFLYFEETDWCLRIRAAGWRLVLVPGTRVWHFKRSTGAVPVPYYVYYMLRNHVYFTKRYFGTDFEAAKALVQRFVKRMRDSVQANAPDKLGTFEKLTEMAFEDGRDGRLGRRDDIDDFTMAEQQTADARRKR